MRDHQKKEKAEKVFEASTVLQLKEQCRDQAAQLATGSKLDTSERTDPESLWCPERFRARVEISNDDEVKSM